MTYLLQVALFLGLLVLIYLVFNKSYSKNSSPMSRSDKTEAMWAEANQRSERNDKRDDCKATHRANVSAIREHAEDGKLNLSDKEIAHLSRKYK